MVERCACGIHYDSEAILELAREYHDKLDLLKNLRSGDMKLKIKLYYLGELGEPIEWFREGLTVVRDGYTEEGVRVHVVKQSGIRLTIKSNAIVFSEEYLDEYLEE